ncbi:MULTISPECIES: type I-C CRISPR-associated protein Cas5c [Streptomyces]|uniref:type I-C CRISPR-associated protein Cas5c n=1 Tax=Streptomyces TaxID=1883 RepID=UPI000A409B05|nr:type I-C CRISPR-associated protein Cas5c [Streptomyces sp. XY511]
MPTEAKDRPPADRSVGLPVDVEVWGPLACFTRPELKVERVSYPVMTPSAAKGVLEAIFWKPEMVYRVTGIEILRPVSWFSMRRNEVKTVVGSRTVRDLRAGGKRFDVATERTQRATIALQDVAYRIRADVSLAPDARPREGEPLVPAKYRDQFVRRVKRGACFSEPFLGCREFSAAFGPSGSWQPAETGEAAAVQPAVPVPWSDELGVMLHSITYADDGSERYSWFRASVRNGVMEVPAVPLGAEELGILPGEESGRTGGRA